MATCMRVADSERLTRDKNNNAVSAKILYSVSGVADNTEALNVVRAAAPARYSGMWLNFLAEEQRNAAGNFIVAASYVRNTAMDSMADGYADAREPAETFDVSGTAVHIQQSRETIARYCPEGYSALDFYGAIGVGTDGSVSGVDVSSATATISITSYYSPSKFDTAFRRRLIGMFNRVNNAKFNGFEPGELLYLGGSGSRRGDSSKDYWAFTHRFAVQLNEEAQTVGGVTVPFKRGWDLVWSYYCWDIAGSFPVRRVRQVSIERIYEYADYKQLGI